MNGPLPPVHIRPHFDGKKSMNVIIECSQIYLHIIHTEKCMYTEKSFRERNFVKLKNFQIVGINFTKD